MKQLRSLVEKLEHRTNGSQQLIVDLKSNDVHIVPDHNANVGIIMRKNLNSKTGLCRLEFEGYVSKLGAGLDAILEEAGQIKDFIDDICKEPIIATEEEMIQWAREITSKRFQQAIADAAERGPQIDPTMGMM